MCESLRYHTITKKLMLSVGAAGVMCFCGIVVETALNIAFPHLMKEFGILTSQVQWLTTGFMLVTAVMIPVSPFLNDRFSKRELFFSGLGIFTAGLLIDIFASGFPSLLAGRIIQGIGAGIGMPLMYNIILSRTPISRMGIMMGVGTLNIAVAPAVGPVFGGLVMSVLSWRYILIFMLPLLAAAAAAGLYAIDSRGPQKKRPFDMRAFLWISFSFTGFVYGIAEFGKNGAGIIEQFLPFGLCAFFGYLFVKKTISSSSPLIDLHIFSCIPFRLTVFAVILMQITSLSYAFLLPNYMQISLHTTAMKAGLILLPGSILGAVLSPLGGRLMDTFGAGIIIASGGCVMILAAILYVICGTMLPAIWISLFCFIYMAGVGIVFPNTMTNAINHLERGQAPDGNAVLTATQQISCAVGTSCSAAVVAFFQQGLFIGTEEFSAATKTGTFYGFLLALLAIITSFLFQYLAFHSIKRDSTSKH